MALTPNATYTLNGVTVNEKIIPDGTVWKNATNAKKAGFSAGDLYKKQEKLSNKTGKAKFVTIHNTNDLESVNDDAEQYTRATYNENMGSARVHFYVDDIGAWQNLRAGTGLCSADPVGSAEVSWHSGDGSVKDGGNMTSLSIEIIMGDTTFRDTKAKDNGARLAAWLLYKHGLTVKKLVTHTYWVNKSFGKTFSDVDVQCTNPIAGEKWCPTYIFGSGDPDVALKNWKEFKALVKSYLDKLNGTKETKSTLYCVQVGSFSKKSLAENCLVKAVAAGFHDAFITTKNVQAVSSSTEKKKETIEVGDKVKMSKDAPIYGTKDTFADFIYSTTLYVRDISGSRVVISTLKSGAVSGAVDIKYLSKV